MAEDLELQFDEDQAVKFIRDYLPDNIRGLYSDDEILNILDMIWDFYEENGLLELPTAAEISYGNDDTPASDKEAIMTYVDKMLAKDKLAVVDKEHVHYIVEGELAYERSIGLE